MHQNKFILTAIVFYLYNYILWYIFFEDIYRGYIFFEGIFVREIFIEVNAKMFHAKIKLLYDSASRSVRPRLSIKTDIPITVRTLTQSAALSIS